MLDLYANNPVQRRHRNLPRKPWSLNALLPDGHGFYPDLIVRIKEGPRTEEQALLAEPKFAFVWTDKEPKVWAGTAFTKGFWWFTSKGERSGGSCATILNATRRFWEASFGGRRGGLLTRRTVAEG